MMRRKLGKEGYIDPSAIMGVVVALIVLAVGVFAFFTVTNSLQDSLNKSTTNSSESSTLKSLQNITGASNTIFNILPIVLTVGVIAIVLGMVYPYFGPSRYDDDDFSLSQTSSPSSSEPSIPKYIPPKKTSEQIKVEEEAEQQKQKEKEKEQIHEKYFKGRTSRVGRTIKYIEDEEKEEGGKK